MMSANESTDDEISQSSNIRMDNQVKEIFFKFNLDFSLILLKTLYN